MSWVVPGLSVHCAGLKWLVAQGHQLSHHRARCHPPFFLVTSAASNTGRLGVHSQTSADFGAGKAWGEGSICAGKEGGRGAQQLNAQTTLFAGLTLGTLALTNICFRFVPFLKKQQI